MRAVIDFFQYVKELKTLAVLLCLAIVFGYKDTEVSDTCNNFRKLFSRAKSLIYYVYNFFIAVSCFRYLPKSNQTKTQKQPTNGYILVGIAHEKTERTPNNPEKAIKIPL